MGQVVRASMPVVIQEHSWDKWYMQVYQLLFENTHGTSGRCKYAGCYLRTLMGQLSGTCKYASLSFTNWHV